MRDPYVVLGVPRDASLSDIEAAYAELHRDVPPDPWGSIGTEEVDAAYAVLSDPDRRAAFDSSNGPAPAPPLSAPPLEPPRVRELRRTKRSWNPVDRMTAGLPRPWRVAIDWIVTIVGAVAIVLAIKAWVVNPYRIPSSSMEPTLHCARSGNGCMARFSDRVLACRFCYHLHKPHRGDIIVFKTPPAAQLRCGAGGTFVKRLIGLPGDRWAERNGFVYINGKKLKETYVKSDRRDTRTLPARRIPAGRYFMMGDNRLQSCDSREWGSVPRANLVGDVFAVYWPPNRIGFVGAVAALAVVGVAGAGRAAKSLHSSIR